MGAPTEVYVDPSIAAASGSGTTGDPYGDLQHALDSVTRDATNGNRFNIKAGTAEVLTGTLSVATYGSPSATAPLIFQGYTSTAGDGGQGEIDGNATYAIWDSTSEDGVHFVDMKLGDVGANHVLGFDNNCSAVRCEIHTQSSGAPVIDGDFYCRVIGCHFSGIQTGIVIYSGEVLFNFVDLGTNNENGIEIQGNDFAGSVIGNIVKLNSVSSGANGIKITGTNSRGSVIGNSVYNAAAGAGSGIWFGTDGALCANNLIEGFSGVGGIGIEVTGELFAAINNAIENCTTEMSGTILSLDEGNESLSASPFASTTTFQPADTGDVLEGAYPTTDIGATITYSRDKGAVQLTPSGGGGGGGVSIIGGLVR